jgi:hypothetical protein
VYTPTGILASVCKGLSYQLLRNLNESRYEKLEKIGQAAATCQGFGSVFATEPCCWLSTNPATPLHWYAAQKHRVPLRLRKFCGSQVYMRNSVLFNLVLQHHCPSQPIYLRIALPILCMQSSTALFCNAFLTNMAGTQQHRGLPAPSACRSTYRLTVVSMHGQTC